MRQPQSFYTFRFFFSGQLFLTLDILIRSFLFLKCEYSTVKRPAFIIDFEDSDVYNNQPVRNNCLSLVTGRRTSLGRDVVYELPALILACDIRKGRFVRSFCRSILVSRSVLFQDRRDIRIRRRKIFFQRVNERHISRLFQGIAIMVICTAVSFCCQQFLRDQMLRSLNPLINTYVLQSFNVLFHHLPNNDMPILASET